MKKVLISLIYILLTVASSITTANAAERISFGLFGNYGMNIHYSDFRALPGVPNCCEKFSGGTGYGYSLGGLFESKINSRFAWGIRADYFSGDAELTSRELTSVFLDGETVKGEFEHFLSTATTEIGGELFFAFSPGKNIKLSIGIRGGYRLGGTYRQYEHITEPYGRATFYEEIDGKIVDTGSSYRNEYSGDIPDMFEFSLSPAVRLGFPMPLNTFETMLLEPEISYRYNFIPGVKGYTWNESNISAGLAFKYSPFPKSAKQKIMEEKRFIDTVKVISRNFKMHAIVPGKPRITTTSEELRYSILIKNVYRRTDTFQIPQRVKLEPRIDIAGINENGEITDTPTFKIEEFLYTKSRPMLNYVFFDENSADIPERYIRLSGSETANFRLSNMYQNESVDTYYHLLNIIGNRMRQYPDAEITVTGCNSDFGPEAGNRNLSWRRAESIKAYLSETWGIDENRIISRSRNLPERAAFPKADPDRAAENRRAEITSRFSEILAPVVVTDTVKKVIPPTVRMNLGLDSDYPPEAWQLSASLSVGNDTILTYESASRGDIPKFIDWELTDNPELIPQKEDLMQFALTVADTAGNTRTVTSETTMNFEVLSVLKKQREKISDKYYDKYDLILFDFAKSELSEENLEIIDFVRSRINENSVVFITGMTDKIGNPELNLQLSQERADAVKEALGVPVEDCLGIGVVEDENDRLPEVRFYNRAVVIDVMTPVE